MKNLEILVTEDQPKHLADARAVSKEYEGVNFTFAETFEKAAELVQDNNYDAVVSDVFFPLEEGGEPTSDSGLRFGDLLEEKDIPFVYNTSGNHHGSAYKDFQEKNKKKNRRRVEALFEGNRFEPSLSEKNEADEGLHSGKLIESYPRGEKGMTHEQIKNLEADTKQWDASFNYAIILNAIRSYEGDQKEVGKFLSFNSRGDYGGLTRKMKRVLDSSNDLDSFIGPEYDRNFPINERRVDEETRPEFENALNFIRETVKKAKQGEAT